jgi:hypothetical protein
MKTITISSFKEKVKRMRNLQLKYLATPKNYVTERNSLIQLARKAAIEVDNALKCEIIPDNKTKSLF